jgi:hypothetical protein
LGGGDSDGYRKLQYPPSQRDYPSLWGLPGFNRSVEVGVAVKVFSDVFNKVRRQDMHMNIDFHNPNLPPILMKISKKQIINKYSLFSF